MLPRGVPHRIRRRWENERINRCACLQRIPGVSPLGGATGFGVPPPLPSASSGGRRASRELRSVEQAGGGGGGVLCVPLPPGPLARVVSSSNLVPRQRRGFICSAHEDACPPGLRRSVRAYKRRCCRLTRDRQHFFPPTCVAACVVCARASSNFHGVDAAANGLVACALR